MGSKTIFSCYEFSFFLCLPYLWHHFGNILWTANLCCIYDALSRAYPFSEEKTCWVVYQTLMSFYGSQQLVMMPPNSSCVLIHVSTSCGIFQSWPWPVGIMFRLSMVMVSMMPRWGAFPAPVKLPPKQLSPSNIHEFFLLFFPIVSQILNNN